MLLPSDIDSSVSNMNRFLTFKSGILNKKFEIYSKFKQVTILGLTLILLIVASLAWLVVLWTSGVSRSIDMLPIDIILAISVPLSFAGCFFFNWTRRSNDYGTVFCLLLVLVSSLSSLAQNSSHLQLGAVFIIMLASNFIFSYPVFIMFAVYTFAIYIIE